MPKLTQNNSSQNIILNLEKEENNIIIKPEELELKEKEQKFNSIEEAEKELEIKKLELKEKELNEKEIKLKKKEIMLSNESNKREVEDKNNKFMKENIITIKIISFEQSVYFSISCNKNDSFVKIEELFYKNYPKYKESKNYFLCNGNKINRFKTLEENGIRNNDIISINSFEP
jgi:hypothetical protein